MNKIVFFNHYHRGDLHTSKEFVKEVMNKLPNVEFEYWHSNPEIILQEIGIGPSAQKTPALLDKSKALMKTKDALFINTWVGCQWDVFCKHGGINMHTLYEQWQNLYKGINKFFETDLKLNKSKELYLPRIDFDKINQKAKANIDKKLKSEYSKKVLICNNTPASTQSFTFNIDNEIKEIAEKNPDIWFILTNQILEQEKNISYTSDIIGTKQDPDLQEISYLSSYMDVIVGKNSGPFVFCETYDNYMDKDKTFVSFNTKHKDYDDIKETMSNGLKIKCKYNAVPILNITDRNDEDIKNIVNSLYKTL